MIASREFVIKKLTELITEPKKKYSQNFLTDYQTVVKTIDSLDLEPGEEVIEVGPGLGALTEEVAKRGYPITAYEIDEVMVGHLTLYFKRNSSVKIVPGDFMKASLDDFRGKKISFVSNLPYNLTTPMIEKIIMEHLDTKVFTFMIQKEVAGRISAKISTKEYSPLSIMMSYLGKVETVCKVTKDKYIPSPNVDSVVLRLVFKEERDFDTEKKLFTLLNRSFAMRRKTILNNLKAYLGSGEKASEVLAKAEIAENTRPEQISLEQYLTLLKAI